MRSPRGCDGIDGRTGELFSYGDLEKRVPAPLRLVRSVVNEVLTTLDGDFFKAYADGGRASIPPEFARSFISASKLRASSPNTPSRKPMLHAACAPIGRQPCVSSRRPRLPCSLRQQVRARPGGSAAGVRAPPTATGVSESSKDHGSAIGATPNATDTKANAVRIIEAHTTKEISGEFCRSSLEMRGFKGLGVNSIMIYLQMNWQRSVSNT